MVGTIFGLGLQQQLDANGDPMVGCKLYLYEAGTSTEVTAYADFGLTSGQELTHPIVADAAGRLPAFWLADGSYRVRLTDANGNEVFDESSITAIGASSGTASGGGVSTQVLFQTGDMIFTFDEGSRDGWIKAAGTIGNSSSGANNRANADTESLFAFLWANVSDTYAPVSGGRGGSAAADFAASKTIAIPSMAGRSAIGTDDMFGTAAGVVAAATVTAYAGGSETTALDDVAYLPAHTHGAGGYTVASHAHGVGTYAVGAHTHGPGTFAAEAHTHGAGTLVAASHNHDVYYKNQATTGGSGDTVANESGSDGARVSKNSGTLAVTGETAEASPAIAGTSDETQPTFTGSSAEAAPAVEGTSEATGSGTAFATISPYRAGTWYIKL